MNISLTSIKKFFVSILHRYHVIIFVILVVGGMAVFIFFLNSILILSGESNGYTSTSNNATFDQATMDRIEELKTLDQTDSQLDLSGRSNPFVE